MSRFGRKAYHRARLSLLQLCPHQLYKCNAICRISRSSKHFYMIENHLRLRLMADLSSWWDNITVLCTSMCVYEHMCVCMCVWNTFDNKKLVKNFQLVRTMCFTFPIKLLPRLVTFSSQSKILKMATIMNVKVLWNIKRNERAAMYRLTGVQGKCSKNMNVKYESESTKYILIEFESK